MTDALNAALDAQEQQNTTEQQQTSQAEPQQQTAPETTESKINATLDRLDERHGINKEPKTADAKTGDGAQAKTADATGKQPNAGASGQANGDGTGTQQQSSQQTRVRTKDDGKGNLVNAQTGEMIAPAGPARRFYTEAQQLRGEVARLNATVQQAGELASRLAQAEAQIETYKQSNTIATQLGLTIDESVNANKLFAAYKKDPKGVLKYMLTEAQASGIDISGLVQGGHIATDAIAQLIDKKLAPVLEPMQHAREAEQSALRVQQQYQQFITAFPDAKQHENEIALIMGRMDCDAREAYFVVKNYALENGLDWNKPLRPQIEARMSGTSLPANGGAPVIPNGRGNPGSFVPAHRGQVRDPAAMSNADIVRDAMREAGF